MLAMEFLDRHLHAKVFGAPHRTEPTGRDPLTQVDLLAVDTALEEHVVAPDVDAGFQPLVARKAAGRTVDKAAVLVAFALALAVLDEVHDKENDQERTAAR